MAKPAAARQMSVEEQRIASEASLPIKMAVNSATGRETEIHRTPGGAVIKTGYIPEVERGALPGRPADPKFQARLASVHRRLKAVGGVPSVTLINMLPFALVVNSPMTPLKTVIPAAPEPGMGSDDFSHHVFEGVFVEAVDEGDDERSPFEFAPIQLAEAYLNEYRENGGVVVFEGYPTAENMAKPEVQEAMLAAKEIMVIWMRRKMIEGNAEWSRNNEAGRANINEIHHACGRMLLGMGLIDELPAYMLKHRTTAEAARKCPTCTTVPALGQAVCTKCNYILDPRAAFEAQIIDEESPALERLTREEVEDMGISDYVAETSDERKERLKAGLQKPLSLARQRAMEDGVSAPVYQQASQQREQVPAL